MKIAFYCLMIALMMAAPAMAEDAPTDAKPGDVNLLAAANAKFACDLYARLKETPGNLFFSPFSVSTALAMTASGARGQTQAQMQTVLGNIDPRMDFAKLLKQINDSAKDGNELSVANALWGQKGFAINPDFINGVTNNYGGSFNPVDFAQAAQASQTINQWVARQTHDKIKDLVDAAMLSQARLVLTNAIYFKAEWETPFEKSGTVEADFNLSPDTKAKVQMMHANIHLGYFENESMQAVEMAYKGKTLSMIIMLPKRNLTAGEKQSTPDGLAAVEKQLTPEGLAAVVKQLQEQEVAISLPKFTMTQKLDLTKTLPDMGMTLAFDKDKADFSGMSTEQPLYISQVMHKAYVSVDEQGTEAAAATGVVMRTRAVRLPKPMPKFTADHPFVFMIRDNATGSILFIGRVMKPGK